jgi:hypothetical protein
MLLSRLANVPRRGARSFLFASADAFVTTCEALGLSARTDATKLVAEKIIEPAQRGPKDATAIYLAAINEFKCESRPATSTLANSGARALSANGSVQPIARAAPSTGSRSRTRMRQL